MYQHNLTPSCIKIVIEEYLMTWANVYNAFYVQKPGYETSMLCNSNNK